MTQLEKKDAEKKLSQPITSLEQMKQQRIDNDKIFKKIFSELNNVLSKLNKRDFSRIDYIDCLEKLEAFKKDVLRFYETAKTYVLSDKEGADKAKAESLRQLYKDQVRAVNLLEEITFVQGQVKRLAELSNSGGVMARKKYDAALLAAGEKFKASLQEQRKTLKNLDDWEQETQLIAPVEFTESSDSTDVLLEQQKMDVNTARQAYKEQLSALGNKLKLEFSAFKKYMDTALPLREEFAEIAGKYQQLEEEVSQYLPSIDGTAAVLPIPSKREGEKLQKSFCERQESVCKDLLALKKQLAAADNPNIPSVPVCLPKTSADSGIPTIQQALQAAHQNLEMRLKALMAVFNLMDLMTDVQKRFKQQNEALDGFKFASFDRMAASRISTADSKQVDGLPASVNNVSTPRSSIMVNSLGELQVDEYRRLSTVSRPSVSENQMSSPLRGQTPVQTPTPLTINTGDSKSSSQLGSVTPDSSITPKASSTLPSSNSFTTFSEVVSKDSPTNSSQPAPQLLSRRNSVTALPTLTPTQSNAVDTAQQNVNGRATPPPPPTLSARRSTVSGPSMLPSSNFNLVGTPPPSLMPSRGPSPNRGQFAGLLNNPQVDRNSSPPLHRPPTTPVAGSMGNVTPLDSGETKRRAPPPPPPSSRRSVAVSTTQAALLTQSSTNAVVTPAGGQSVEQQQPAVQPVATRRPSTSATGILADEQQADYAVPPAGEYEDRGKAQYDDEDIQALGM